MVESKKIEVADFRRGLSKGVREAIEAHLAIEAEDAKQSGNLGFMARAMVHATVPYKDPKTDAFYRRNGNFTLRIVAGYEGGIPFGIYPRLLLSWVTKEAVRTQSRKIQLGNSLRVFMSEIIGIRSSSGGRRGAATRAVEQMKRLFGSLITASGKRGDKEFILRNVMIAHELFLEEPGNTEDSFWTPQQEHEAGTWQSHVLLTEKFFEECVTCPVPFDLRAYMGLRSSPLAMDTYLWLTYRLSYLQRATHPIPWEPLMMQFGANYTGIDGQAVRDFKKGFLKALALVKTVYPKANVTANEHGVILSPSPPHIPPNQFQKSLW